MDPVEITSIQWSTKLSVASTSHLSRLTGDKIVLPQSALEQIIAAAPLTVTEASQGPLTSSFDPFNPYSFDAERRARALLQERQPQLPQPLIFRLANPDNGRIVYAGVREFSANEDTVVLSDFLKEQLGIEHDATIEDDQVMTNGIDELKESHQERQQITVSCKDLPKGTFVKLRPLEAGYDPDDWKALLEQQLRSNFTTLTNGEELTVPVLNANGKEELFRFLVDGFKPESDGICIVDTDLEVDIEALDEAQARETLKRISAKKSRAPGSVEGSSAGGELKFMQHASGQIVPGEYVDYELMSWDRSQGLDISLSCDADHVEVDLLISPLSSRQRAKPREDQHVFANFSPDLPKSIQIRPTNIELEGAEALRIAVFARRSVDLNKGSLGSAVPFEIRAHPLNGSAEQDTSDMGLDEEHDEDEVQCKNCRRWVSKGSLFLHENFCLRNNILCPKGCGKVFQKRSPEYQTHWHCPLDASHGDSVLSRGKHDHIFHTNATCPSCSTKFPSIPELSHHRVTECPGKLILCQFCHLEVPQEGDPAAPPDPEVLISGLTPHELADGGRTTECHLCNKIVRLRDMNTHLRHHDLQRSSRPTPRLCRNVNCGRTQDGANKSGDTRAGTRNGQGPGNDLGLCSICFGPLYVSLHDPEGKAMKRRVERRYLSQLLTGCGKPWCRNEFCKTGRSHTINDDRSIPMKEGIPLVKPFLQGLVGGDWKTHLHFCVDEASQSRRPLAEHLSAERGVDDKGGYSLEWCVAALEAENGDAGKAREWLKNWAPTTSEEQA